MKKILKWLAAAALVLGALEGAYVGLANWALNSGLLARLVSRRPERLQVEWESGKTLWPGVFHLKGLRARGQSERLQTYVQADACSLRMHLFLLASLRVHFSDVEARGVSLWVRHRRELGKSRPMDRHEPPIPGLAQDAPAPARKPYPSPWTLRFASVRVEDLREIWIGPYKTTGRGRAEGSTTYRLRGALSVDGSHLWIEEGKIAVGEELVASGLQVDAETAIRSVVPREHRGRPFLKYVSGRYKASGQVTSLGFLNEAMGEHASFTLKGRGQLAADVAIRSGVMGPGTSIEWQGEGLSAAIAGLLVSGKGSLSGGTAAGSEALSLTARWSDITVTRSGLPPISPGGPGLTATLSGPRLDLAEGGEPLTVTLDLPESTIKDLSVFGALMPAKAPFTILAGSAATVRAHLQLHGKDAQGGLSVEGSRVGLGLGEQALRGPFYAEIKLPSGDLMARSFDITGTRIGFRSAAFSDAGGKAKGDSWSGEALVTEGSLHSAVPGDLTAKVALKMTDTRPVVAVFAANYKAVRWFKGFFDVKDVTGRASVKTSGRTAAVDGVDIQGSGLRMLAHMRLGGGKMQGAFYAQLHGLSAAFRTAEGRHEWKLIGARKWYEAM